MKISCLALVVALAFSACEGPEGDVGPQGPQGEKGDQGDPGADGDDYPTTVQLMDRSVTPALVKKLAGFENLNVYSLIGSDDKLIASPSFTFGGSADGAGLLKVTDGYLLLVNHEDNYSVSRIMLDNSFKPVSGEYILNSTGGQWRLCSATMATPEEHGFGPLYLTCGESGEESRTNGVNPFAPASSASVTRDLPGLGRWSAENAVPLPKDAYEGTIVIIGDDDDATHGGQLAMYVSSTRGDLANGKLYVLRRTDLNVVERDMTEGTPVNVEFVEIANHTALSGAQINAEASNLSSIKFGRVEDLDYRKGSAANHREIYFNVTGQNNTGVNADNSRSKYGRTYKLTLNESDSTKGTLELILDGDNQATGKAKDFQNVDNLVVTENYVYVQEDPNSGYGTDHSHDAYIYQYNIATKELKPVIELDHRRTAADAAKYNAVVGGGYPQPVAGMSGFGSWEYGAMIDISDIIGIEDTFILSVQPHTWQSAAYKNPDGGTVRPNEQQASQMVIIQGLPR